MGESCRLKRLYERAGLVDPERAIRKLTRQLLLERGKKFPPFSPEVYCQMLNIEVDRINLDDCDARLLPVPGGYIAEVNVDQPMERQNFSVCHELGHTFFQCEEDIFLSEGIDCSISIPNESRLEERLCNLAASELLMPQKPFQSIVLNYSPSLPSVRSIGKEFLSSYQAVVARIIALELWECIVAFIQPVDRERIELGFEVKWWKSSQYAFKNYLTKDVVIACLRGKLRSQRGLNDTGVLEAFTKGRHTCGELVIDSLHKGFSIQSMKFNQNGNPFVFSLIYRSSKDLYVNYI